MSVRRLSHDGAAEKSATRFANVAGAKVEKAAPEKPAEISFAEAKKLEQQK